MTEMIITSIAIFFAIVGMIIGLAYVPGARGLAIPCFFLLLGLSLAHTVWIWNATMFLVNSLLQPMFLVVSFKDVY